MAATLRKAVLVGLLCLAGCADPVGLTTTDLGIVGPSAVREVAAVTWSDGWLLLTATRPFATEPEVVEAIVVHDTTLYRFVSEDRLVRARPGEFEVGDEFRYWVRPGGRAGCCIVDAVALIR